MTQHLMLVPSLACPASCQYCFGPHTGSQTMNPEVIEAVVQWQNNLNESDSLEITFHGGEPLVPGAAFYRDALQLLRDGLAPRRVKFAIQSNLWLLDDELCQLFQEYRVAIGTSLDGQRKLMTPNVVLVILIGLGPESNLQKNTACIPDAFAPLPHIH